MIRNKIDELFGIDIRSLALFRICLGLLLLLDLLNRFPDVTAFYTDWGVYPRVIGLSEGQGLRFFSIHYLFGGWRWETLLFSINAVLAFAFMIGYRTWLMNALCWYLLCSLHARDPLVLQGGDILFRLMMFWAMFLPLGACWSIDRILNPTVQIPRRELSMGTAAVLIQTALVYWFTVIFKWNQDWLGGMAVYYALNIDAFATPIGLWVRQSTFLLTALDYITLFMELVCPIAVFTPFFTVPIRIVALILILLLHIGFALCMELGLFPFFSMASWIPFIPSAYWDNIPWRINVRHLSDNIRAHWPKWLTPSYPYVAISWIGNSLALVLIVYVLLWNAITVSDGKYNRYVPPHFNAIGSLFQLGQTWNMFSIPPRSDGWFVIPAELLNGQIVDLFKDGAPLSWEKPALISETYHNERWRKYLMNLLTPNLRAHLRWYGRYQCIKWNSQHRGDDKVKAFQIVLMTKQIYPHAIGPARKIVLWNENCISDSDGNKK